VGSLGLGHFCGLCEEPVPVDLCQRLGHNAGTDGHFCSTKDRAEEVLLAFQRADAELFDDVFVAKLTIEIS